MEDVDQTTYNAFVQKVEREARRWNMECRTQPYHVGEVLKRAQLEVYYGQWHVLGWETPFVPAADRQSRIDPEAWERIQHQAAADLVK